jgi:hypothetical protein
MDGKGFITKLWRWFDSSFLLIAVGFLAVFIPLYPKIPIGDIIPGYIVRIRLEDVFIGLIFFWWLVQIVRKKLEWRTPLTFFILSYLTVGLLSNILGVVLTKTIPAQMLHIGKSMLHWFRHIEYFSLFFIAYSAVKNKADAFKLIFVSALSVIGVVVYGYGQKYMYWPVYSTMNREFSKGIRLYLGEFARVQSTFAGHYDLGAYLVILLPIVLAMFFALGVKKKDDAAPSLKQKILHFLARTTFLFAWLGGLWILALSASRTSFIGYLLALGIVMLLMMFIRGIVWGFSRGFLVLLLSVFMMVFVGDLTTRFAQLIDQNKNPKMHAAYHTVNDYVQHPQKLLGLRFAPAKKPDGAISVTDLENDLNKQGMTVSDTTPSTTKPQDVYTEVPEKEYELNDPAATLAGALVQQGDKLVKERTYSDCALERSLSLCIRFETLWPRAIQGFMRNPLFGSGYATLNKSSFGEFTEAESTDNNFLRTLGENGLLGFIFYYGLSGIVVWYAFLAYKRSNDVFIRALGASIVAGTFGLLLNATYIDVFVASKVAYTFWMLQGIALAVFVKEGVVAPKFAFERKAQVQKTSELASLLAKVEKKAGAKSEGTTAPYLSLKKKRQKSMKPKKRTARS